MVRPSSGAAPLPICWFLTGTHRKILRNVRTVFSGVMGGANVAPDAARFDLYGQYIRAGEQFCEENTIVTMWYKPKIRRVKARY